MYGSSPQAQPMRQARTIPSPRAVGEVGKHRLCQEVEGGGVAVEDRDRDAAQAVEDGPLGRMACEVAAVGRRIRQRQLPYPRVQPAGRPGGVRGIVRG